MTWLEESSKKAVCREVTFLILPNAPNLTHIGFKIDDHDVLVIATHEDATW